MTPPPPPARPESTEPAVARPPGSASVRLCRLTKIFPGASGKLGQGAVNGLELEISSGEFMVLVGPSGCGKSTTLRMIAGLEEPTAGTIEIGGRVVNQLAPNDRGIAMVFQNYALYPHMTVFENMAFGLKLAKWQPEAIRSAVHATATTLGLETLLHRKPQALSGGERQRVALGRAIVRNPPVFLFDEPLSNLDARMRVQMRAEIRRLHARLGATMIYVTHDQVEAMTMGDRICVLREGAVMQVADPLTLYHQPAHLFVAGFIGSPPMNLLPGRLHAREGALDFVAEGTADPLTMPLQGRLALAARPWIDRPVVLGIRPEHLAISGAPATHGVVHGIVEISEPTGEATVVYLRSGATALVARIGGELSPKVGDPVTVHAPLEKLHLFDPVSERAIG